jgi:trk system potassium uptake protein TrkA
MKQFAVIGLGSFGLQVARRLAERGTEVLAIDVESERVEAIKDLVGRAVIADATDKRALTEMDLGRMDGVMVCLGSIEDSVLAVLHLREMKVRRLVAMAVSPEHVKILKTLGADRVIYPEMDAAERLAGSLSWGNVLDHVPLAPGYSILEAAAPSDMVGRRLCDSGLRQKYNATVIGIRELVPEAFRLNPGADFVIKDSDILILLAKDEDLERFKQDGDRK